MAALATDRITPKKDPCLLVYPVAASTKIYGGSIVGINSGGYAIPAADAASVKVVGVATKQADNSAVATNGAINVEVETRIAFERAGHQMRDDHMPKSLAPDCRYGRPAAFLPLNP